MNYSLLVLLVLSSVAVSPTVSLTRWFTASFYNMRYTLNRYVNCSLDLEPVTSDNLNKTDYLIYQMTTFLDQCNFDNEQWTNVSSLMDTICQPDNDQTYQVSMYINVSEFVNENNPQGKANRCKAIDHALEPMYHLFRRASLNHSEPIDFSEIKFYPNATNKNETYSVTDLINTIWIKSDIGYPEICSITESIKRHVNTKMMNETSSTKVATIKAEKRVGDQQKSFLASVLARIDLWLDQILGFQRRLMWENTNRLDLVQKRLSSGWGSIRKGLDSWVSRSNSTDVARTAAKNSTLNATAPINLNQSLAKAPTNASSQLGTVSNVTDTSSSSNGGPPSAVTHSNSSSSRNT